jgi:hypothetical protein
MRLPFAEPFAPEADPLTRTAEPFALATEPFALVAAEPFALAAEPFVLAAEPFVPAAEPFVLVAAPLVWVPLTLAAGPGSRVPLRRVPLAWPLHGGVSRSVFDVGRPSRCSRGAGVRGPGATAVRTPPFRASPIRAPLPGADDVRRPSPGSSGTGVGSVMDCLQPFDGHMGVKLRRC